MTILRYAGIWWDGTDVALIAIPPIKPNPGCKVFDIWESTSNFLGYNKKWKEAKSCAIVGFPLIKKYVIYTIGIISCDFFEGQTYSHQPLVSFTTGHGIVEFGNKSKTMRYFCKTHQGMSGGAVEIDDKIVGSQKFKWCVQFYWLRDT